MQLFETAFIGDVELQNRVLRSGTFEGLADKDGNPTEAYCELYNALSSKELGGLITGFVYVSRNGRAMQPGQAGIECDAKITTFRRVTQAAHQNDCRVFLQIAHAGRQTSSAAAQGDVVGPSARKSRYFQSRPRQLTVGEIEAVIEDFARAGLRARNAGFDGIQLHAAHGYLIHQFLNPCINDRKDFYGVDSASGIGTAFLEQVIKRTRALCGTAFPILIKISAGDTLSSSDQTSEFIQLIRFLDTQKLAAIEISFGTMDRALNIFRGESIPLRTLLRVNPRYATSNRIRQILWRLFVLPLLKRQLKPFTPAYNLQHAVLARRHTTTPLISVGGFRTGDQMRRAVEEHGIDFVSICRPLICEPDFVLKIRHNTDYQSRCKNCNECAIMCDSGYSTRCYQRKTT